MIILYLNINLKMYRYLLYQMYIVNCNIIIQVNVKIRKYFSFCLISFKLFISNQYFNLSVYI